MAVPVHPVALPCGVQTVTFEPSYTQAVNRARSGDVQAIEQADARWRAEIAWAPRTRAGYQARRAWLDGARGALVRVLVHDALQPYPLRYPRALLESLARPGGTPFDGTASVMALSASSLTLGILPPGFVISAGDYVGLVEAGKYGLVRVFADAVADTAGHAVLTVYPTGQTKHFSVIAQARLVRPACLMVIDPGAASASRSAAQSGPVSFTASQALP